jgi:rubrerythrin
MKTPPPTSSGTVSAAHQLARFLRANAEREDGLFREYRGLCEELPTPALRYFARLILADEERHQMIFGDLAETVYANDDLKASGMPILESARIVDPFIREQTSEMLDHCIDREKEEDRSLTELIAALAPGEHSALWSALINFIAQDTKRHLDLLEFMRSRML